MFYNYDKSEEIQRLVDFVVNPVFIWLSVFFLAILAIVISNNLHRKKIELTSKFFFIVWCLFLASEIAKECFQHFCHGYSWLYNLPLQFSSLPLYCFLMLAVVKNKFWKDVARVFAGPYLLAIALLFWSFPNNILTMVSYFEVFQSITWHFSLLFFGVFITFFYRIYTFKYIKQVLVAIGILSVAVVIGATLNWYLQFVPTYYFYVLPWDPVYPVIEWFWHSTSPFPLYVLIFVLTFIAISCGFYLVLVGIHKLCCIVSRKFA